MEPKSEKELEIEQLQAKIDELRKGKTPIPQNLLSSQILCVMCSVIGVVVFAYTCTETSFWGIVSFNPMSLVWLVLLVILPWIIYSMIASNYKK